MEQETYVEDMIELMENAIAPLEKYFATFIDIGNEDQEPRKVFVDDIGKTGLALVAHAQDELRSALAAMYEKLGPVAVTRATPFNQLGVKPRQVLDAELAVSRPEQGDHMAKQ